MCGKIDGYLGTFFAPLGVATDVIKSSGVLYVEYTITVVGKIVGVP